MINFNVNPTYLEVTLDASLTNRPPVGKLAQKVKAFAYSAAEY